MKRKRIFSFLLMGLMLTSNTAVSATTNKDETVYVSLSYDGTVKSIKVVNHLYGYDAKSQYVDYGEYDSVRNLSGAEKPEINGNEIKWPMELLKKRDLYYEGSINKKLPVDIKIRYFLDEKEIKGEELGGKSGHLKLELGVVFNTNEVKEASGIMAQAQIVMDQEIFTNIKTEGTKVVVGKKSNISFVALPSKEQTFTLEADGRDIEIEPINISLLPAAFSIPKDIKASLDELTNGLGELQKGALSLEDGSGSVIDGMNSLRSGIIELNLGMRNLSSAANQMSAESQKISEGLEGIHGGLSDLNGGISQISSGMKELQNGHEKLEQLAQLLQYSDDPMVMALAKGVLEEGKGIESLSNGLQQSSAGLNDTVKGFGDLKNGTNQLFSGYDEVGKALSTITEKTAALPQGVTELISGQEGIRDGINRLNKNGIGAMKTSMEKNLESSFLGGASKNTYSSFVDNDRNKDSTVQFVLRTTAIEKPKNVKQIKVEKEEKKSFIQRIIELFS